MSEPTLDLFLAHSFPGECDQCGEEGRVVICEEVWFLPGGGEERVSYTLCREHTLQWLTEMTGEPHPVEEGESADL